MPWQNITLPVESAFSSSPINRSSYRHYTQKFLSRPPWVRDVDGYRSRFQQDEHGTTHVYDVPWSGRLTFMRWVLGYSYAEQEDLADNGEPNAGANGGGDAQANADGGIAENPNPSDTEEKPEAVPVDSGGPQLDQEKPVAVPALGKPSAYPVEWVIVEKPAAVPTGGGGGTGGGGTGSPPPEVVTEEDEIVFASNIKTFISRVLPDQDPQYPWLFADSVEQVDAQAVAVQSEFSYAQDAAAEPLKVNGMPWLIPMPAYIDNQGDQHKDGTVRYAVTYRPRTFALRPDDDVWDVTGGELRRYVTRAKTYQVEALRLGNFPIKFSEGPFVGTAVPEAGIKLVGTQTLVYTWHQVPFIPHEAIRVCGGRVNAGPFDGFDGAPTYAKETLLFLAPHVRERKRNIIGGVEWDIEFRFLYRPTGWNKFPAGDGNYYRAAFAKPGLGGGITGVTNADPTTITTATAHGLVAGDAVIIASVGGATGANGTWTVATVPTANTFTIDLPPVPKTITGVTNEADPTITTATAHSLSPGQSVTISGVVGAGGVNGNRTVLAGTSGATTFTITLASAPGVYVSGGTATTSQPGQYTSGGTVAKTGTGQPVFRTIDFGLLFERLPEPVNYQSATV